MKINKKIKLKSQSAENERQCWDELLKLTAMEPEMVLIDATRAGDGRANYRIYKASDNSDLAVLGVALLMYPEMRYAILTGTNGRKSFGLVSEFGGDVLSMVASVDKRVQLLKHYGVSESDMLPLGCISNAVPPKEYVTKVDGARFELADGHCPLGSDHDN